MSTRKDLLKTKGRIKIFDEVAKSFTELTVVDNINVETPPNPIEIKSPSGVTILTSMDMDLQASFDWFHPGNADAIEKLFRGAIDKVTNDGSTTVTEDVEVKFNTSGDAVLLPGFNGDKTVVTVNTVKLKSNLATTYTVTDDYTVTVDADTGFSYLTHVGGGVIPVGVEIVVNYDYDPLESNTIKPNGNGVLEDRFIIIDEFPDCNDLTKYRRWYLPHMTANSAIVHSMLKIGEDNQSPNIMPVTMMYKKPEACSDRDTWYMIDTYNV